MNDKLSQTMKILRSPKVRTDDRGRTVWADTVETASLELVSTQMLKQLIEKGDEETNDTLREVAAGSDGLLARDVDKGRFEVISDEELQHILDGTDAEYTGSESAKLVEEAVVDSVPEDLELELVSTQMLRTILGPDDDNLEKVDDPAGGGFNPYDNS